MKGPRAFGQKTGKEEKNKNQQASQRPPVRRETKKRRLKEKESLKDLNNREQKDKNCLIGKGGRRLLGREQTPELEEGLRANQRGILRKHWGEKV